MKALILVAFAYSMLTPAIAQVSTTGQESTAQAAESAAAKAAAVAEEARLKREAEARAEADREREIRKIEAQLDKAKSQQK